MQKIYSVVSRKLVWFVICALGVTMLAVALYYQHARGDAPCEVCIHIRIWVTGFTLLSFFMLLLPPKKVLSVIGYVLNAVMAAGLLERSLYLLKVEQGKGDASCGLYLDFPNWFALDKWLPDVYEVRNVCSYSPELLWGVTMTEGLISIAALLLIGSAAALSMLLLYKPVKTSR